MLLYDDFSFFCPVCSSAFHTVAAYFDLMRLRQRYQVCILRSTFDPLTCAACFEHFHLVILSTLHATIGALKVLSAS